MTEKTFKVRDLRKKEQFIIDDSYLNGYAKIFGPSGTAVYLSLCRRANKEQFCFPSERLIAKDHGITEKTARKYLRLIEKVNIIRIEKERRRDGKYQHKIYYLLDKSEWKHPSVLFTVGNKRHKPTVSNEQNQRYEIPTKDAHWKEAHQKDSAPPSANADISRIKKGNAGPMSLEEAVEYFKKSSQRHIQIIGDYAKAKKPDCRTGGQWHAFMKRNLRAATDLAEFDDGQIENAAKKIWGEEWLKHWTLETLLKYLINNH